MTTTINGNGDFDLEVRSWSAAEAQFQVAATPVDVVLSGASSTPHTVTDLVYEDVTGGEVRHDAQIVVGLQNGIQLIRFESLEPAIATVDTNGYVTRVSDGLAPILMHTSRGTRKVHVPVSLDGSPTTVLAGFASGSVAKNAADFVDGHIAGLSPSIGRDLFLSMDHVTPAYVRNPDCWMAACTNKSAFSVWNSRQAQKQHGTLVSPRDFICVDHYSSPIRVGDKIRWVADDNSYYEGTVAARTVLGQHAATFEFDCEVFTLTEDVPSGIQFCKILPEDWRDYIPALAFGAHPELVGQTPLIPIFRSDQNKRAYVAGAVPSSNEKLVSVNPVPPGTQRSLYWQTNPISGDSGSPGSLIINNEAVYFTMSSGGWDITYPVYNARINEAMTDNGSPYQLTDFDLSGFNFYG